MSQIIPLNKSAHPRRFHGQCQRCDCVDYLPWATEHGIRFCGPCSEKDALEYARLAGWTLPVSNGQSGDAA
jgi:hypothetical protein